MSAADRFIEIEDADKRMHWDEAGTVEHLGPAPLKFQTVRGKPWPWEEDRHFLIGEIHRLQLALRSAERRGSLDIEIALGLIEDSDRAPVRAKLPDVEFTCTSADMDA